MTNRRAVCEDPRADQKQVVRHKPSCGNRAPGCCCSFSCGTSAAGLPKYPVRRNRLDVSAAARLALRAGRPDQAGHHAGVPVDSTYLSDSRFRDPRCGWMSMSHVFGRHRGRFRRRDLPAKARPVSPTSDFFGSGGSVVCRTGRVSCRREFRSSTSDPGRSSRLRKIRFLAARPGCYTALRSDRRHASSAGPSFVCVVNHDARSGRQHSPEGACTRSGEYRA